MTASVVTYVFLSLSFLFFVLAGYIRGMGSSVHKMSGDFRDLWSRTLIIFSALSIAAATIAGAKDKKLDSKDALEIVIVMLAIVLLLVATWQHWGLFALTLITVIAILASVQLIIVN